MSSYLWDMLTSAPTREKKREILQLSLQSPCIFLTLSLSPQPFHILPACLVSRLPVRRLGLPFLPWASTFPYCDFLPSVCRLFFSSLPFLPSTQICLPPLPSLPFVVRLLSTAHTHTEPCLSLTQSHSFALLVSCREEESFFLSSPLFIDCKGSQRPEICLLSPSLFTRLSSREGAPLLLVFSRHSDTQKDHFLKIVHFSCLCRL